MNTTAVVGVEGDLVSIDSFVLVDPTLARLLESADDRPGLVARALAVGVAGLTSMGIGVGLAEIDSRVARTMETVTKEAETRVRELLAEAGRSITNTLDPDQRTSMVGRLMADIVQWREGFLRQVDPKLAGSHTGLLLEQLGTLLGPGGALEQRLSAALDPASDGSGIGKLIELIDKGFREIHVAIGREGARDEGRAEEALRGTAKGFEFEDTVEANLRKAAHPLGAMVERTSRAAGSLPGDALVGDFVVCMSDGLRVAVEAKNVRSIGLNGTNGVLAELDRAMANRGAEGAVCVSAQDAFPHEVGQFWVYGNRVLVVDDGDGVMLAAAIRFAFAHARLARQRSHEADPRVVDDKLERLSQLAHRFSSTRRALTEITGSVEKVKGSLDDLRSEMVELVDGLVREFHRGDVVDMRQVG